MPAARVVDAIERAVYIVAQSIMTGAAHGAHSHVVTCQNADSCTGAGLRYAVPSRANSNQLYIKELDRIVRAHALRANAA